jgi:hypothetical protein
MRDPDLSELARIVAAAEARTEGSMQSTPAANPRQTLRAIEDKAAALFTNAFPQLDKPGLERLRHEHDAELRRLAEENRRRSADRLAAAAQRLDGVVAAERAALAALPLDPFGAGSNLLLKVDFIRSWPTPGNLRESRQQPGVNWAKYAFKSASGSLGLYQEKVSFYNVWQNPRDVAVLADVLVRLTALGHVACSAEGSGVGAWFGITGLGKADISARLTLWGLWTEPAPVFLVDSVPLGTVSATGGFFGDSNSQFIASNAHDEDAKDKNAIAPAVTTKGFVVPPRASILIEASLAVDYHVAHGAVDVDFASQDLYSVGWAYAVVTIPADMMVHT